MKLICIKSPLGIDLLNAKLAIGSHQYTFCGLAKTENGDDGLLWQWWIIMEDAPK